MLIDNCVAPPGPPDRLDRSGGDAVASRGLARVPRETPRARRPDGTGHDMDARISNFWRRRRRIFLPFTPFYSTTTTP